MEARSGKLVAYGAVFLLSIFLLMGFTWTVQAAEVINWKFAHGLTVRGPLYQQASEEFGPRLEKATGGRLKVTHLSIITGLDVMTALRDGRVQVGDMTLSYVDATYPIWNFSILPDLIPQNKKDDYLKVMDEIVRPYVERDVRRVYNSTVGLYQLWDSHRWYTPFPLKKLDDFKGKKFRTDGVIFANMARAYGGAPVSMPFSDVYTSLQRRLVDGCTSADTAILGSKMYEVLKYISNWHDGIGTWATYVSLKALDALPADLRPVVVEEIKRMDLYYKKAGPEYADKCLKELEKHGMIVIEPSPEDLTKARELIKPVQEEWFKISGNEGREVVRKIHELLKY